MHMHMCMHMSRGRSDLSWPVYKTKTNLSRSPEIPETKKETRGSPALFVSGNFQGNQRVFKATV